MRAIIALLILFFCLACDQAEHSGKLHDFGIDGKERWITDRQPLPATDSLFYLEHPAPLFRKEFSADRKVKSATLQITAAGYYIASINGKRIGKNVLDPAWTDYSKRIFYSTYDVTALLEEGANCLGVTLGNGFYNPLPLRKWGRRNLRDDLAVGKPAFLTSLKIQFENGKIEEIVSDNSWKYSYGPIMKNSVYIGVAYDARRDIDGWDSPGIDDQSWENALECDGPGGKLQEAFFPPVRVTDNITPVKITSPSPGIYLVDMGVNFTGTYKIRLSGDQGDKVSFRFGERVYEDGTLNPMTSVIGQIKRKGVGGPGAPDIAWQTDSYILNEEEEQWFTPDFTYHTYRYMEIAGLKNAPQISDITGLAINSDMKVENSFSCSSPLLNSIQEATERTFLANLVSVQSDCPAREKFGYGGDINATSESFIYNFDMQAFYRKTIYDWIDAMNDSSFVDTAPFVGIKYCGISWESAFLITQYYLYLYYHDTDLVRELYELDRKWMEKAARIHPQGMVHAGLSDHESLEPVPVELTGTAHYLQCAEIMSTFAKVMGNQNDEERYLKLADNLRQQLKTTFWVQTVEEKINRQTLFATLLYHKVIPESEQTAARDSLLAAVQKGPSGHFNTGIFGTKYVLETLSEYASPDLVFDIVNSRDYPGWGHMIDRGATTIWETWKESDNTYSNCHPMFGTVTEWYYRWLGGIRPIADSPGFEEFILAPNLPDGLEHVQSTYQSPYGEIVSNWQKEGNGDRTYEFKIPQNTIGHVTINIESSDSFLIEKDGKPMDESMLVDLKDGTISLSSGHYFVTVSSL